MQSEKIQRISNTTALNFLKDFQSQKESLAKLVNIFSRETKLPETEINARALLAKLHRTHKKCFSKRGDSRNSFLCETFLVPTQTVTPIKTVTEDGTIHDAITKGALKRLAEQKQEYGLQMNANKRKHEQLTQSLKRQRLLSSMKMTQIGEHKKQTIRLAGKEPNRIPSRQTVDQIIRAKSYVAQRHVASVLPKEKATTLYTDET